MRPFTYWTLVWLDTVSQLNITQSQGTFCRLVVKKYFAVELLLWTQKSEGFD